MLVQQIPPEAQTLLQQPLQVKPDWTIHAGDVLKRVLPWNSVAHSLMTSTSMGEAYDKRLQGMQGLAGLHKHADGYGIFHAFPCLCLVLSFSTCCTCQAMKHSLMGWSDAEHGPPQVQQDFCVECSRARRACCKVLGRASANCLRCSTLVSTARLESQHFTADHWVWIFPLA